ncbi:16S rRNA (uracil(1498)-N(3))-methyltransferase [Sanguibacter sp. HDW7]|uniref:16S rRNA (uracil(1498)-N(3))-methyltransferase n=1 Tax=Sanguibacter sp. HDW7 TaxID=2714931 RepID=UPI0014093434|nr:16S rRNA (uracil(1498)-N(3))-methyltransferase [Sanguibacter sp. HDW7]QIK83813.1 16S rRNA (uracil(1498)-N(3))-methyltransferase [Sanguibacter sp. HDW7]
MSAPVFLAEASGIDRLSAGDHYLLDGPEGRHAGVVQRRRPGEAVDVVDGLGVRARCTIESVHESQVRLLVDEVVQEPLPQPELVLVQALAKGDRDEMAVEAATEVGADAVVPWQASRSIVVWRGDRAAKSRARWVATVRTAAKQSRRARLPHVEEPVTTTSLAALTRDVVAAGGAVLVLHESAVQPLAGARIPAEGTDARILVVVGPEGGIASDELTELEEAGAQTVLLGPHVLRTSTAGPVALALLAQRLGRWG